VPDAMAAGARCFSEQPLTVANTSLIWIAINNHDRNICKLTSGFTYNPYFDCDYGWRSDYLHIDPYILQIPPCFGISSWTPQRRARGPGAPPLASVTLALPAGDGAKLVLPGRALLPTPLGKEDPVIAVRRTFTSVDWTGSVGEHLAHVHRGGGTAPARRRAPHLQLRPPGQVRAQVSAGQPQARSWPSPTPSSSGTDGSAALFPGWLAGCSARPRYDLSLSYLSSLNCNLQSCLNFSTS
jgi:hypothetical protein